MAKAEIGVVVDVESVIHKAIREAVAELAAECGVRVTNVSIEWIITVGQKPEVWRITVTSES